MDLTVVDSFTGQPFAGNPAAVAVVDAFPDEARMQAIAREMNLSETAFVVPRTDGSYDLRWFTPAVEVELCGHATLAAAHVLGGTGTFHTKSGELVCAPGGAGWIEMDFPADPPVAEAAPPLIAVDCVSRVFAPNAGIAEDPVTGSAHCALAAYWGDRLGRDTLVGEQASARGGVVRMTRKGQRVVLSGQAVTVSKVHLVV